MAYGNINVGHVSDCNKDRLERMLQDYDNQLYIKWNPKRNKGVGCWQIRRRPDHKTLVYHGEFNGGVLATAEWVELDVINHVLDVERLTYDLVGKVKSMDAWAKKDFAKYLDEVGADYDEKVARKTREDLLYHMKQYRSTWRDMQSALASGQSLGQLLKGFKLD